MGQGGSTAVGRLGAAAAAGPAPEALREQGPTPALAAPAPRGAYPDLSEAKHSARLISLITGQLVSLPHRSPAEVFEALCGTEGSILPLLSVPLCGWALPRHSQASPCWRWHARADTGTRPLPSSHAPPLSQALNWDAGDFQLPPLQKPALRILGVRRATQLPITLLSGTAPADTGCWC